MLMPLGVEAFLGYYDLVCHLQGIISWISPFRCVICTMESQFCCVYKHTKNTMHKGELCEARRKERERGKEGKNIEMVVSVIGKVFDLYKVLVGVNSNFVGANSNSL